MSSTSLKRKKPNIFLSCFSNYFYKVHLFFITNHYHGFIFITFLIELFFTFWSCAIFSDWKTKQVARNITSFPSAVCHTFFAINLYNYIVLDFHSKALHIYFHLFPRAKKKVSLEKYQTAYHTIYLQQLIFCQITRSWNKWTCTPYSTKNKYNLHWKTLVATTKEYFYLLKFWEIISEILFF